MRKLSSLLLVTASVVALNGCEPPPDEIKLLDEFVVTTNYLSSAEFSNYNTYYLPTDTIGLVSNIAADDTIIVGSSYARPVLSAIRNNLDAMGYQEVEFDEDPDVGLNVYVLKNLNIFQDVNYFPGGYGYPGYYPGYGYGGYYGYPYVSTYAYNTGVLVIEMVDLKNLSPQNTFSVVWNAYMGDVYSALDRDQQTLEAIDQSFEQSPYLTQ